MQVTKRLDLNIIAVLPAAVVGIVGGIMGAAFTFLNLKISRTRRNILSHVKSKRLQKSFLIAEPLLIMVKFIFPYIIYDFSKAVSVELDCLFQKIHFC